MSYDIQTIRHGTIDGRVILVDPFLPYVTMGNIELGAEQFAEALVGICRKDPLTMVRDESNNVVCLGVNLEGNIGLGEYVIPQKNFYGFANHFLNGGAGGWDVSDKNWKPEYVKNAEKELQSALAGRN